MTVTSTAPATTAVTAVGVTAGAVSATAGAKGCTMTDVDHRRFVISFNRKGRHEQDH